MKIRSVGEVVLSIKKALVILGSPLSNFSPYSNLYVVFRALASVITEQDVRLSSAVESSFLSTARGELLDKKAADYNLYRKIGSKARGQVLALANTSAQLKKGTILSDPSQTHQYELLNDINLSPGIERPISVQGLEYSQQANLISGTSLYSTSFSYVKFSVGSYRDPVTNRISGDITGGRSTETDDEFRQRIRNKFTNSQSYIGTASSIKEALLSLPFINRVFIIEHRPVTGYFTVMVDIRDQELIKRVVEVIERVKPIGVSYLVEPIISQPINIKLEVVTTANDIGDLRARVREAVVEYFDTLNFESPFIRDDLVLFIKGITEISKVRIVFPSTDLANPESIGILGELSLVITDE